MSGNAGSENPIVDPLSQGAERKTAREKDLKHERLEEARSKASICYFLMAVLSLSTGIQPGIIFFLYGNLKRNRIKIVVVFVVALFLVFKRA